VQDEGLQTAYNDPDDRTLKEFFHSLLSLGFVPLDYVEAAYDALSDDIPEEGLPVAVYFEENYIVGRRARGRRRAVPPRFPAKYWNCYTAPLQDLQCRNNISEGWHNRFQLVVGKHHPSVYSAFDELLKEQDDTESTLEALALGQTVKAAPNKTWKKHQERLREIVATYQTYKDEES